MDSEAIKEVAEEMIQELENDLAAKGSLVKYSYQTTGNRLTLEIFHGSRSVVFMQGDEAALNHEIQQCLLSQYDY